MITPWLSIKCLFVFSDLPQSQLTTLHQTYTFQLCLANSVSIRLSAALSINRPFATCDLHCLQFFTAILPNIGRTTTQDDDNAQCFVTTTFLLLSNNAVPWHEPGKYRQFLQYPAASSLCPFLWGHLVCDTGYQLVSLCHKLCVSRCVYRYTHFIDTFQTGPVNCLTIYS